MQPIIRFNKVTKLFKFNHSQFGKLLDVLAIGKKGKQFCAVKDLTFDVYKGESIGIVGINGSGKSTLSNLLAQVTEPSFGEVQIDGEPSLIAISAGLNNNLTGTENIELKCLMLGIKRERIKEITPNIIEFADIGDFIEQPVKNYSSGMKSRLGFAISAHTNPDIIIIDEALSVGDQTFYEKCLKKIEEFKANGKTIFFVSHSISQMRTFSDRIMWLHFGQIREFGDKNEVLESYKAFINWFGTLSDSEKKEYRQSNLQNQFSLPNLKSRIKRRNTDKQRNKREKSKFLFQLSLLIVLLLVSIVYMFKDQTFSELLNFPEDQNSVEKKENSLNEKTNEEEYTSRIEEINNIGYISSEIVQVYENETLKGKPESSLVFSDKVIVKQKIGDVYSIELEGQKGFIEATGVSILEEELPETGYSVEEILPYLPENFSKAYSFYLKYLGKSSTEIILNLSGVTSESTNLKGNKEIKYPTENISYTFSENDVAESLTIHDVNITNLTSFFEQAKIQNKDQDYFYEVINRYGVILDTQNKQITFKSTNQ